MKSVVYFTSQLSGNIKKCGVLHGFEYYDFRVLRDITSRDFEKDYVPN